MKTKLYILWARAKVTRVDCQRGVVVEATSSRQARKLAAETAGDEGKGFWLDPKMSTCWKLKLTGVPMTVMRDFNYG